MCSAASSLQTASSSLLHALQKRDRLRAACMQVTLTATDDDVVQQLLESSAVADAVPVLQVIGLAHSCSVMPLL
jgi:hypothetical protein